MKKIYTLIIVLLLCTSCNKVIVDELPKNYYIELNNKSIPVYSESTLKDILNKTNVDLSKDEILKTNKVGTIIKELKFTLNKKNYIYHIKYNVIDNEPPKIYGGSDKTVNIGYEGNLCNMVMYGDNYDKSPKCNIIGNYNLNEKGTYNISIEVVDSSNNKSNHNIKLNVIDPVESKKETTEKITTNFNNIYNNHKNDNTMIGIDVSRWQGDIDFNKVKASGVEFVIMRIGVQQKLNEDISMDSKYLQNIKAAHESDLKVGVYLYSMSMSKSDSIKQAKWVIDILKDENLELGIVFDWENWSNWNSYKLSFHDINEIMYSFIDEVKKSGYEGILYSSKFYLENIWNNKNNYPVWLAHYTDKTNYEGKYKLWQLCNNGKIDGINGDVDIDIMYLN